MRAIWPVFSLMTSHWVAPVVDTPSSCLSTQSTLESLITCLDAFTVPANYYTPETYAAAQPTDVELSAWTSTIFSLLSLSSNCTKPISVPLPISGLFAISTFTDEPTNQTYRVFYEQTSENSVYAKGWGVFVVPASHSGFDINVHISAPHPAYDLDTPRQAAALFKATRARSLLIPGRVRTAFKQPTECIQSSKSTYYATDPAHDVYQPFFAASKTIWEYQNSRGGCSEDLSSYIQFHGKGTCTCASDHIFLSSGLGPSSWYTDATDRPIKRLQAHLRSVFPTWTSSLPNDSTCTLTATENVFGRLVNGVPEEEVCDREAEEDGVTGEFIHIEQARESRREGAYVGWAEALRRTFGKRVED